MSDKAAPAISLIPAEMHHALTVAHAEVARLRMTDAEREALTWAEAAAANAQHRAESVLRTLRERMGGEA